jgi:hypothetical protein
MKYVKNEDADERLKVIFDKANDIFHKTFEFSLNECKALGDHPIFQEMSCTELLTFFSNIYTKILCQGFEATWDLKQAKLKENETTKTELLNEWIKGIYLMFGSQVCFEHVRLKDQPITKLNCH